MTKTAVHAKHLYFTFDMQWLASSSLWLCSLMGGSTKIGDNKDTQVASQMAPDNRKRTKNDGEKTSPLVFVLLSDKGSIGAQDMNIVCCTEEDEDEFIDDGRSSKSEETTATRGEYITGVRD